MPVPRQLAVCLALALAALLTAPRRARADNRREAARDFARADAEMNKKDYRDAIADYHKAYAAAPAAAVLYNIGVCYQKLAAYRKAAHYFRRYLDESKNPPDRDKVLRRLGELKSMPSKVSVSATPAGATIFIDGKAAGAAPVQVTLESGPHTVYAAENGRTSRQRHIDLEYGEPATLALTLGRRTGILAVGSNVHGAEVLVDGDAVGVTPFRGAVPAGAHTVRVDKPGFRPAARRVTIPAEGSQVIEVKLVGINGKPPAPTHSAGFVFGVGYGYDAGASARMILVNLGARTASQRWQADVIYGTFGSRIEPGLGVDAKLYLGVHTFRPYLRTGFELGSDQGNGAGRPFAFEFGGGLLIASQPFGRTAYAVEYFVEADVQTAAGGVTSQQLSAGDLPPTLTVPLLAGVVVRTGG